SLSHDVRAARVRWIAPSKSANTSPHSSTRWAIANGEPGRKYFGSTIDCLILFESVKRYPFHPDDQRVFAVASGAQIGDFPQRLQQPGLSRLKLGDGDAEPFDLGGGFKWREAGGLRIPLALLDRTPEIRFPQLLDDIHPHSPLFDSRWSRTYR